MPLVVVLGLPQMHPASLRDLRQKIVNSVVRTMSVPGKSMPKNWVRPFLVPDLLGEELDLPSELLQEDDGSSTVYARVDTGMILTQDPELPQIDAAEVTADLAKTIWEHLGGEREVEVFIGHLDASSKTLLEAKD